MPTSGSQAQLRAFTDSLHPAAPFRNRDIQSLPPHLSPEDTREVPHHPFIFSHDHSTCRAQHSLLPSRTTTSCPKGPKHCLKPSPNPFPPSSTAQPFSPCQVPQTQTLLALPMYNPSKSLDKLSSCNHHHSSQQNYLGTQTDPGAGKSWKKSG